MNIFAHRKRVALALVAAIVLALQTLGSAWASAVPMQLDAFGNPLCVSNSVEGGSSNSGDKANFAGCCTLACGVWTGSPVPPDEWAPAVATRQISEPLRSSAQTSVSTLPGKKQGNPRAPPIWI